MMKPGSLASSETGAASRVVLRHQRREVVLARGQRIVGVEAPRDDDVRNGQALHRFVERRLERHHAAAAQRPVGDDDHFGRGVLEPIAHRRGGEAGEDDGVDGADAIARREWR